MFRFRYLTIIVIAFALVGVPMRGVSAQAIPVLSMPDNVTGYPGDDVVMPITFARNGNLCAALTFSIDFDETRLAFDPTDSDFDGIPDSVTFSVSPPQFGYSVIYDPSDTDSELDFLIADTFPPLVALQDGVIVQITFTMLPDFQGSAPVAFSADPPPSCGTTTGTSVPITGIDGLVSIPTAVGMESFIAQSYGGSVRLGWETVSELTTQGFNLWRASDENGIRHQLNASQIPAQAPGSAMGSTYESWDLSVILGQTYWYWLEEVDFGGNTTIYGPVSTSIVGPTAVHAGDLSTDVQQYKIIDWISSQWARVAGFLARLAG